MAVVYRHIDNFGKTFYIGIGKGEDRAFDYSHRSDFWKRYANKYGVSTEILTKGISFDKAKELEVLLISEYGRRDLGTGVLVNMTDGGEGSLGRKQSKEEKQKRANSNRGKKRSYITKKRMSESRKGMVFSDKHIENLKKSHLGLPSGNSKKVIDLNTNKIYRSLREGCLENNLNYKTEHCRMSRNSNSIKNKFKYI